MKHFFSLFFLIPAIVMAAPQSSKVDLKAEQNPPNLTSDAYGNLSWSIYLPQASITVSGTASFNITTAFSSAASVDSSGVNALVGGNISVSAATVSKFSYSGVTVVQGAPGSSDGSFIGGVNGSLNIGYSLHLLTAIPPKCNIVRVLGAADGSDGEGAGSANLLIALDAGTGTISGTLDLSSLTTIEADAGATGGGAFADIYGTNHGLDGTLDLSNLATIRAGTAAGAHFSCNLANAYITHVAFAAALLLDGSNGIQPELNLSGCGLDQASVDAGLAACDAGGSNNAVIDFSGGTNAAPVTTPEIDTVGITASPTNGQDLDVYGANGLDFHIYADSSINFADSSGDTVGIQDSPTTTQIASFFAGYINDTGGATATASGTTVTITTHDSSQWTLSASGAISHSFTTTQTGVDHVVNLAASGCSVTTN